MPTHDQNNALLAIKRLVKNNISEDAAQLRCGVTVATVENTDLSLRKIYRQKSALMTAQRNLRLGNNPSRPSFLFMLDAKVSFMLGFL